MYREIERKFIVSSELNQPDVDYILKREFNPTSEIYGESDDYYYRPSAKGTADFVRLRNHENGRVEFTVKAKDRKSNFNRLEINVEGGPASEAKAFCNSAFGVPTEILSKKYSVFIVQDVIISTYVVGGDNRVFLEVEGVSETAVNKMVTRVQRSVDLTEEKSSLYELFVQPKEEAI